MAVYVKKTAITIFIIGLLVLTILSILGTVYLTKMAFSDEKRADGNYCGGTTTTERNIARLAIVTIWLQFSWIVIGSFIRPIWEN
jgi:hypothetical protein